MTELDDLRERLTDDQRAILNAIWHYHCEHNKWMSARVLHHRFGKAAARSALEQLGGSIAFETRDEGKEHYKLTFLGLLLTDHGEESEHLLARYLEYLRDRFVANPEMDRVKIQEVAAALGLTAEQSRLLIQLIYLGNFWGEGFGGQEFGVPYDLDDLPSVRDFCAYVRARALKGFDPAVPFGEGPRMRYLLSTGRDEEPRGEFWFISDPNLQRLLAEDWQEAQRVHEVRAWKSCVLLCGGIVEGVLLDALGRDEQSALQAYERVRGKVQRLDEWHLKDLVDVAEEMGVLRKGVFHLTHALREFRNLVHPGKQVRQSLKITEQEANIALAVVKICLRELGARRNGGKGKS